MSTLTVFIVCGIPALGAVLYRDRKVARLPARARWRRGDASTVRRCARPLTPPLDFPRWSEKAARLFLEGGSCRWE